MATKNDNNTSNNSAFIIIIGIIIATARVRLDSIKIGESGNEVNILAIMAVVNYIALGFVLLFLNNDLVNDFKKRLKLSGLSTFQKRNGERIISIINIIYLMIYLIIGLLYVSKHYNSVSNDVFSIIALSISIANDGLIELLSKKYYSLIIKLTNI